MIDLIEFKTLVELYSATRQYEELCAADYFADDGNPIRGPKGQAIFDAMKERFEQEKKMIHKEFTRVGPEGLAVMMRAYLNPEVKS